MRVERSVYPGSAILGALLIGLILGFAGSMPIAGPTAAVIVSRGLENRRRAGFYVAIGSAIPETMYAFMAFWGLTAMIGRFPFLLAGSRLVGCLVLTALGVYFVVRGAKLRSSPHREDLEGRRNALLGFTMTVANPTLIVSWTAAVGVAHSTGLLRVDARDALPFAGGVGLGTVTWFAALLWILERFRERVSVGMLDRIVRGMGWVLLFCGIGLGIRLMLKSY
jgi:threonine/homoserine/homoserine lactone efflux protein